MTYSFEYIDIILLAMIAGFIFLRLRGILGKRTGFEGKAPPQFDKILNVTVDFIAEVITCIKDKDKKIISGDPEKIKKIYDTWVFSRDTTSANPNWQLVNTLT